VAVPPAPDAQPGLTSSTPHPSIGAGSRSGTFRLVLLGVLVVALLASAGTMIWLLAGRTGKADSEQSTREAVMSQAEQFVLRIYTYGPDLLDDNGEMPEYRKRVTEVITPKFKADFEKNVTLAEQTVSQAGLGRTVKVFGTGVSSIDADSAVVLVAGSFTSSYPKNPEKPDSKRVEVDPVPFRFEISLVKTGGKWLIDDFNPASQVEQ
jgi:Mce-associated membrane protein